MTSSRQDIPLSISISTRLTMVVTLMAAILSGGAYHLAAQGGGDKGRKPLCVIEVQLRGESGRVVRVSGTSDLPDGAEVTVYLFHAVNRTLVDTRSVVVKGGSFVFHFGPFEGGLYDGTYIVECTFLPGLQKVEVRLNLREYDLVTTTTFTVGSVTDPVEQVAQMREVSQETLLVLRGLLLEMGRLEHAARSGKLTASDVDNWSVKSQNRLDSITRRLARLLPAEKSGCPFQTELGVLEDCTTNFQRLRARRLATKFSPDVLDPADSGKTPGELLREGKAPSWMLRELFIHSLVRAFNTLGIRDPVEEALEDVANALREAFLVLMRAYVPDGVTVCRDLSAFDKACAGFKSAQERVAAAFADVAIFFEERHELLGAEEERLSRYLAMKDVNEGLTTLFDTMRKVVERQEPLAPADVERVVELCRKLSVDSIRFCCSALEILARQLGGVLAAFTCVDIVATASNPWGTSGTKADDDADKERWLELRDARVAASMRQFENDFGPLRTTSAALRQFFTDSALQWFLKEEARLRKESAGKNEEPPNGTIEILAGYAGSIHSFVAELSRISDLCRKVVEGTVPAADAEALVSDACASAAKLAAEFQKWATTPR